MSSPALPTRNGPGGVGMLVQDGVAHILLGDGTRRNALDSAGWAAVRVACVQVAARPDVHVVVVRGAGRSFCAGSDLREWQRSDADQVDASFAAMESALTALEQVRVPTLAVVEGPAAGAGCQLALACDLRILASTATIGMPIVRLGVLCSPAFAFRLSTLVGVARTKDMLFSGHMLSATQAAAYGLATEVVADADLDGVVERYLRKLAEQPRSGLMAAKAAAQRPSDVVRERLGEMPWRSNDPQQFPAGVQRVLQRMRRR